MNDLLKLHFNKLKDKFQNPEMELRILLKNNLKKKKEVILSNFSFDDINISNFNKSFNRRINNEPISKIFNSKFFWKHKFYVNKNVLDPRPDSEIILEKILEYFPKKNIQLNILDICTGSGCLAISSAKEYINSKIVATDISYKAINVAIKNAEKLDCLKQIQFEKCNLIKNFNKFDIVISNPPYLSEKEYEKTSLEIKLYEPKSALIASESGYEFYYKIAKILPNIMHKKSRAFMEIGSNQADKAIKIFKLNNINCLETAKDIQNLDRTLILNKP